MPDRLWHLLVNVLAASPAMPWVGRRALYRLAGIEIGAGATVRARVHIQSRNVQIGAGSFVNAGAWLHAIDRIEIGEQVFIGNDVHISTMSHRLGTHARRAGELTTAPVTIGDGTWIGTRATILHGIDVAAGCVIAAGAVVKDSTTPDGLYGGVPARRIRDLA
jgi:maltose O-acetyltransferase